MFPVQKNQWFYKNPDYSLSILRNLFKEKAAYPRTAVGNNLSDLARRLPDLVYELVKDLNPQRHCYLGDPDEIIKATVSVAKQATIQK